MDADFERDASLLKRMKTGDESAFNDIYVLFWPQIFTYSYLKTNSREVSEEIVQDLFLSLWLNRKKTEIKASLKSYLLAALHYKHKNFYRAKRIRTKYINACIRNGEASHNYTEQAVQSDELDFLLGEGLNKLSNKSGKVFCMSRFEHQSNKQISDCLNITEKAVEYHITRSMKLFRLLFKDYLTT